MAPSPKDPKITTEFKALNALTLRMIGSTKDIPINTAGNTKATTFDVAEMMCSLLASRESLRLYTPLVNAIAHPKMRTAFAL
ncbi:hypothetical protein LTR17_018471 [Elasticomyces elasticus]|nr:hypothetical protein LTR17_018471 [Elasticomyces elasticus]